ncbi:MAG: signal peptidase II [Candidatus Peribacteria bacterium]|jgi:signal peptidase II|nr:signal peptidase II [Candidatus Peribacteria bacterium]
MPMGVVLGISLVCVVLFSYLFGRRMFTMWEYGLFLAGALGNLRDRVLLGGVRDFIAVGTFPVFNFADAFLTMAVILLCIRQIFSCKTKVKS